MEKMSAIEFANLFEEYCRTVQEGNNPKIGYSSWRDINEVCKKLKRESYHPQDWEAMPLYIDWYYTSWEILLNIRSADKSIDLSMLPIPFEFATFISGYKSIDYEDSSNYINCNDISESKEKENKTMLTSTSIKSENLMNGVVPNFDFGPITDDSVRISPYGMAIKNKDDAWVSYNAADGSVISVSGFTFNLGQMLFKVPVALNQIQKGDMVIHNRVPMYVTDVAAGGTQVSVVDIHEGEIKTVMPPTNMFGFNFVTKVVSFINFQTSTPDPNNPFGNIMPFILLSSMFNDEDGSGSMGDMFKGDIGKMFMYSMMFGGMGGGQNLFSNLFSGLMPQTSSTIPASAVPTPAINAVPSVK